MLLYVKRHFPRRRPRSGRVLRPPPHIDHVFPSAALRSSEEPAFVVSTGFNRAFTLIFHRSCDTDFPPIQFSSIQFSHFLYPRGAI